MGLPKQQVREVIDVYIQAWETQDPDRVVTIFTRSATYHERVLQDPSRTGRRSAGTGSPRWCRRRRTSGASFWACTSTATL